MSRLNKTFTAVLEKGENKGAWTCAYMPGSEEFFGTKGLVKIKGTIDGKPFRSSFMANGDGRHRLPVKAETLKSIGKQAGDEVTITLFERLEN